MQMFSQEHARALRAIGQDLAGLFPECLEIKVTGRLVARSGKTAGVTHEGCFVRGVYRRGIGYE